MSRTRDHIGSRIVHPDLAAVLLLMFVAATAPAFFEDDAAFFNYFANVTGAVPLFYYYGYVSFIAAPIAYALAGLPFVVQAVLYRVVALVAVVILYRELSRFLAIGMKTSEARLLAVSTLLLLRGVDLHLWANLTYAIWPAFLASAFYVIRTNVESRRYSAAGVAGVVLAGMSNPLGLLLVPVMAMFSRFNRGAATQNVALAVLLTAGHLLIYSGSPDAVVVTTNPLQIAWLFVHGYRTEFKLNTAVAAVSLLAIAGMLAWDFRRPRPAADRVMTWSLAFLGVGSVVAYVLSDRFPLLEGGFRSQHVMTVMIAALVIIGRAVLALDDQWRRGLLLGVFLGAASATLARDLYLHLRGPLELALMNYRFLMVAENFRGSCEAGDGMVFEDSSTSPIVLCRPQAFTIGRHPILNFPPAVGVGDAPDNSPIERPGIVVGKPLF